MTQRRWVAIVAALALCLVAGCTSSAGGHGTSASPAAGANSGDGNGGAGTAPLAFHPCPDEVKRVFGQVPDGVQVSCGRVTVPLSWQQPHDGRRLQLAVVRIRSDNERHRIGALLVNPGGPGVSAINLALQIGVGIPALTDRFDIVGFDPRGVGESAPLRCISPAEKDRSVALTPDPRTPAQFTAQVKLADEIATGCYDKYGTRLRYFSTVETARDMDAVRAALGEPRLTYLGFSYGTLLGAVYATLFPRRVRALVLDGAVNPAANEVQGAQGQAAGFEHAFGQFAAWCARDTAQCPIAPDARQVVDRLLTRARRHPIPSSEPGETRKATDGNVLLAVAQALYAEYLWPVLARALDAARRGDSRGILQLDDEYTERHGPGQFSNEIDASIAISCADTAHRAGVGDVRRLDLSWRHAYPLFGSSLALGMLTCAEWKAPADPPPQVSAPSSAPIVVVGSPNDPATPYRSAVALARELRSAVLLTAEGEGHTSYLSNACVRERVDAYLISLAVPKRGAVCPAG